MAQLSMVATGPHEQEIAMASDVLNLTRLQDAGLLDPSKLDDDVKADVAKLSSAEVDTLIGIKEKLGFEGDLHSRQDCGSIF